MEHVKLHESLVAVEGSGNIEKLMRMFGCSSQHARNRSIMPDMDQYSWHDLQCRRVDT